MGARSVEPHRSLKIADRTNLNFDDGMLGNSESSRSGRGGGPLMSGCDRGSGISS